jgi:hypothetical protein
MHAEYKRLLYKCLCIGYFYNKIKNKKFKLFLFVLTLWFPGVGGPDNPEFGREVNKVWSIIVSTRNHGELMKISQTIFFISYKLAIMESL